ncbi:MAG TPA: polysaccharide biosynthesis tyrosine autokinase [Flavobacteriales bacterium]|nr:polysaccharide biosynthesis tyrosine autokinase [Flavobacteriales bacterium]
MVERKVSNLNDEFDLKLFFKVASKNAAWIVLFFIISFLMAFLYLRYTYPIYEAKTIIQIGLTNTNSKMLPQGEYVEKSDLPSKVELLKSPTFLNRVFNKLPLDIMYFQTGSVLNYEMYRTSPFNIDYKNPINELYNLPIFLSFTDENNITLSVNINNKENVYRVKANNWVRIPILDSMRVNVTNYEKIRADMMGLNERPYYFVLNKRENLVRTYSSNLNVTTENEAAGTIKLVFHERNPAKAADICNTIAEEFKAYDIERQSESSLNTIKFVDDQLKVIYDKLYDSEVELQEFKTKNKLNDETPLPDFSSRINDLETKLNNLELEETGLETIQAAVSDNRDIDIYKLVSLLAGSNNESSISAMLAELRSLLQRFETLKYSNTTNSSTLAQIDYQIKIQRKLIIETIIAYQKNINNQKQEIKNRITSYEDEVRRSALTFDRIEFVRLQKLNEISERYYNRLVEIKSELTIYNAGLTSENTVLETSSTPVSPYFPSRRIVALGALIGWILVSLGLVVIRYLFHNEITSLNEIMKYLEVPMLGIVPNYKDVIPISQLLVDKKPKSIIAESLRSIRSNLEFLSHTDGPKVLAITSTISGEGKTFVALNLAGIIAFSEKKVIILDLDMRKPKIHVGFGVPNDKGMSTILINRNSIDDCIFKSSLNNLDFITAGPVPPNPSELIISSRMLEVIQELKTKYDVIVIDNPPVGLVTDGIRVIKMADYPIYVFRENFSKRNFVQNVKKLIRDNNIKNMSIILNSVDIKRSGYGYSGVYDYDYGYGYGYGFGYYDEDIRREKFSLKEFFRKIISK